jgi:D-tyrosyl-tRNA(Tyr) deacylase
MRAVVQRVAEARVRVDDRIAGEIGRGLVVLVGIARDDDAVDVRYLAAKLPVLRLFDGPDGRAMDQSVKDVAGSLLVVSQFTLYGDTRGQRRPSFAEAAPAIDARPLYEALVGELRASGVSVETGEFQSAMRVELVNDGPITVLVDSRKP